MTTKPYISPSDLTFGFSGCHRCLWLKYNAGLSAPMQMPLVGTLSALQEARFRSAPTSQMSRALPVGSVVDAGAWVVSSPIVLDGEPTGFRIRGKYDLLVGFEDGTYAVIDCKVSASTDDKASFYQPQLEAYAFALESPESGEPRTVSTTGLLVWTPNSVTGDPDSGYGFAVDAFWQPVPRDPASLSGLLARFIDVITAPQAPAAPKECRQCDYVRARGELGV